MRRRLRRTGNRILTHGRGEQQGAALAEFALVAPLLFLVIFAIMEFALAIHTEIDFSNGVSAGVRQATILGSGATLPSGLTIHDIDNQIGLAMTRNLRPDDTSRTNYYSVKLIQSRYEPDATQTITNTIPNIYQNYYGYTGGGVFDLNAYDYIPLHYTSVTNPCQYYWQVHKNTTANTIYLDQREKIDLSTAPAQYYPIAALTACGGSIIGTSTTTYTCAGKSATPQYPCYYYPSERADTVNTTASNNGTLPDLLEVQINYTYKPISLDVVSGTPLGNGFTITEHASGRLEPIAINAGG